MAKSPIQDVVKVDANESLPDYLRNVDTSKDRDNFDNSDIVIPRVKLLQGLSPELTDYPEARSGDFWHSGADLSLGSEFEFVVIARKKKYLLSAPLEDGQGVLARADDAETWDRTGSWQVKLDRKTTVTWEISDTNVERSGLTKWGSSDPDDENSPPAATLVYEYLVLLPAFMDLGPVVVSLARSAIRKAKKGLNDKIQLHRNNGRPMQAIKFRAKCVSDQSDSGPFNNWSFTGAGFVDEPTFNLARKLSETLTEYSVQDESVNDDVVNRDTDDAVAF